MTIVTDALAKPAGFLFAADGSQIPVSGEVLPEPKVGEPEISDSDVLEQVRALKARILALTAGQESADSGTSDPEPAASSTDAPPKNHLPQKPSTAKYVLLTENLASWGRVPQQQADVADILARSFPLNEPVSEADVFEAVTLLAKHYPALAKSRQHPTYVFKYYRGLKNDGKHAGFVARGFLKQV